MKPAALLLVSALLAFPAPALPCTAYAVGSGDTRLVLKSYDWDLGDGHLVMNKRGMAKRSLPAGGAPLEWTSKHASVTFNQYGRELPNGGMNDAGLVIEILWLDETRYPPPDARPALNELQWIQYHLDLHGTVAEMSAAAAKIRVSPAYAAVHWFACDAGGACAVFEYLDGRLVVSEGGSLPFQALANSTYARSRAYAGARVGAGKKTKLPEGPGSLARFTRAASLATSPATDPGAAFRHLDRVRVKRTQWQIVYAPAQQRVHFRVNPLEPPRYVDLAEIDGSCATPVRMIALDTRLEGDLTSRLEPWTVRANERLLRRTTRPFAARLPPGLVEKAAVYPASLSCAAAPR